MFSNKLVSWRRSRASYVITSRLPILPIFVKTWSQAMLYARDHKIDMLFCNRALYMKKKKKKKELCHSCRRIYLSETARNAKRETSERDRSHAIIMDVESVTRELESCSRRCRRRRRLDLIRGHSRGGAVGPARPRCPWAPRTRSRARWWTTSALCHVEVTLGCNRLPG